jgi:hypothetical protein
MDEFRRVSVREYCKLVLPFVVLVAFGLVLVSIPHGWRFSELSHKTGGAVIIAGAIAIAVELFALKKLVRHVADDVSFRLAGGHLPPGLRRTLWNVVSSSHVRERWEKEYRRAGRTER